MTSAQWESVTRFAPFKKELDYLQTRPPAQVTVEELAAFHGVTRECFSRKFTQITGISPKKFLSQMILSRACRALSGMPRPFREVAAELGFANEFYFSSFFRKHTGLSPKEYRLRAIR
jgi:transcriptional regulator GlxA family with amidase domain